MGPALFGLVLAGGASTRMRTDKAALQYHGQPQLRWAFELVSKVCAATFVSVRPDQRDDAARTGYPQIIDRQPGIGPIAGISAALLEHPKAAWLVLACDLPFLTERYVAAPDRTPRPAQGRDRLSQRARQLARAALRDLGARGTRTGARVHRERQAVPAQVSDQFGHCVARSARASGTRQREYGGRVRLGDGRIASPR